jgi:mannose-6-phosphate isomerase class I
LVGSAIPITGAEGHCELPFLLKVLSIAKALSIQAHPDKKLAEQLHAERPEVYKDSNHKPEMALAITPVEALCEFRPVQDIYKHLCDTEELSNLIDPKFIEELGVCVREATPASARTTEALRNVFSALVHVEEDKMKVELQKLLARLNGTSAEKLSATEKAILHISTDFPGDIGIFCPYLLNYVTLDPGQAIFLGANEPHAYLSGIFSTRPQQPHPPPKPFLPFSRLLFIQFTSGTVHFYAYFDIVLLFSSLLPGCHLALVFWFAVVVLAIHRIRPILHWIACTTASLEMKIGDIIEAMACSDNVVRAGLTPKFKDKDTLCSMLTYKSGYPRIYEGDQHDEFTRIYTPSGSHSTFRCLEHDCPHMLQWRGKFPV